MNLPGSRISWGVASGLARTVLEPGATVRRRSIGPNRDVLQDFASVQLVLSHLQRRIQALQSLCDNAEIGDDFPPFASHVTSIVDLLDSLGPIENIATPPGQLSPSMVGIPPMSLPAPLPETDLAVAPATSAEVQTACPRESDRSESPMGQIVITPRLSPGDLWSLAGQGVRGIVLEEIPWQSDVLPLARFLQIPVVAGIEAACTRIPEGTPVIVDGNRGLVRLPPVTSGGQISTGAESAAPAGLEHDSPPALLPAVTPDGVTVRLLLNLESPSDFGIMSRLWPDGIGLWRTDLLRLLHPAPPTIEEHDQFHSALADTPVDLEVQVALIDPRRFPGNSTTTFTRDDRTATNISLSAPFPRLPPAPWLVPQVQVLARLAASRPLTVLLPGMDSRDDLEAAIRSLCQIVGCPEKAQLPFGLGVLVDNPASALTASEWLPLIDSVVVDMESLARALLGIRTDPKPIDPVALCLLPSVLLRLANLVDLAQSHCVRLTVAGDLFGDPGMIAAHLALGVRRLTVPACDLPQAHEIIRHLSIRGLGELRHLITSGASAQMLRDWVQIHVGTR